MANVKKCPHCGEMAMTRRGVTHTEDVGGVRVNDATAQALVCGSCGEWDMSAKEIAGFERRAARTVLFDRPDAGGAVYKYARKALGLRQTDLALLLGGVAPETISRWENGEPMPRTVQLALAALLAGVEHGAINIDEALATARASVPPPPTELHVKRTAVG
jgi:DNA-binding XRE family transcriptional regulator